MVSVSFCTFGLYLLSVYLEITMDSPHTLGDMLQNKNEQQTYYLCDRHHNMYKKTDEVF